jgi:hypothetical protein
LARDLIGQAAETSNGSALFRGFAFVREGGPAAFEVGDEVAIEAGAEVDMGKPLPRLVGVVGAGAVRMTERRRRRASASRWKTADTMP